MALPCKLYWGKHFHHYTHLLINLKQRQMASPCKMYWGKHCCHISTTLELTYHSPTSETGSFLQMLDNQKLIQDKSSTCQESCRKLRSLLDNLDRTFSFFRKWISLHCNPTQECNPFHEVYEPRFRIGSIAPAQHTRLAPYKTCQKPSAIDCCLSCSSGMQF